MELPPPPQENDQRLPQEKAREQTDHLLSYAFRISKMTKLDRGDRHSNVEVRYSVPEFKGQETDPSVTRLPTPEQQSVEVMISSDRLSEVIHDLTDVRDNLAFCKNLDLNQEPPFMSSRGFNAYQGRTVAKILHDAHERLTSRAVDALLDEKRTEEHLAQKTVWQIAAILAGTAASFGVASAYSEKNWPYAVAVITSTISALIGACAYLVKIMDASEWKDISRCREKMYALFQKSDKLQ